MDLLYLLVLSYLNMGVSVCYFWRSLRQLGEAFTNDFLWVVNKSAFLFTYYWHHLWLKVDCTLYLYNTRTYWCRKGLES